MFLPLVLSSIASGLIATGVMVLMLYLPGLWNGPFYDVLGALGSFFLRDEGTGSTVLGALVYFAVGIVFAIFYGWVALLLLQNVTAFPHLFVLSSWPVPIDLMFVIIGIGFGLAHGGVVVLFLTIAVIEHHPLEQFRTRYMLLASQFGSHVVYGAVVMFFQSQFLRLFGAGA